MPIPPIDARQQRRAARVEAIASKYQRWISPTLHTLGGSLLPMPTGCRYQPTCSEYAAVAVARYGWWRGSAMAVARLARCHPLSRRGRRGGFDPVP
ncbi:MAG: membrane protein insertion efficiency factor YidD [Acidobacteriaceae bacterium]